MNLITINIYRCWFLPGYTEKYAILLLIVISIFSMLSPVTYGFSINRFISCYSSTGMTTINYHYYSFKNNRIVTEKFNRPNFIIHHSTGDDSRPFSLSVSNQINENDSNKNQKRSHTNDNVKNLIQTTTNDKTTTLWNLKPTTTNSNENKKIVIIGGGASGIFASIAAATAVREHIQQQQQQQQSSGTTTSSTSTSSNNIDIIVVEGTKNLLSKVKISGGGRCNVLHDTSLSVSSILNNGYPRGYKELKSIYYSKFTPNDAKQWFENHNVQLKTESDGRMFPTTDSSQTIINTLLSAAYTNNVQIYQQHTVQSIQPITIKQQQLHTNDNEQEQQQQQNQQFQITFKEKVQQQQQHDHTNSASTSTTCTNNTIICDAIIVATGSSPIGYKIAQSLGHTIKKPVPSLFTLNTAQDIKTSTSLLYNLAGVSVPYARIRFIIPEHNTNTTTDNADNTDTTLIKKKRKSNKNNYLEQVGPLLITHQGLSGPAALRLSSFGANEISAANYCGQLQIHWAPTLGTTDDIFNLLWECTKTIPKRTIVSRCPLFIDLSTIPSIPGSKISVATTTAVDDEYDDDGTLLTTSSTTTTTTTQTAIPKRLWQSMVHQIGLDSGINSITPVTWGVVSKKIIRSLAMLISECSITMTSKNTNKDEFVTAGGIDVTKEINMNTMSSKIHSGLYYCGEIINIDGVTGGFNFMNCWSTGYVAGTSAASYVLSLSSSVSALSVSMQQKEIKGEV